MEGYGEYYVKQNNLVCHFAVLHIDEKIQINECDGTVTWETNLRYIVYLTNMTVFMLVNFISCAIP